MKAYGKIGVIKTTKFIKKIKLVHSAQRHSCQLYVKKCDYKLLSNIVYVWHDKLNILHIYENCGVTLS